MKYEEDEVILYEGVVGYKIESKNSINVFFTLTSKRMIFKQEKGLFKKKLDVIDIINLEEIKIYNDEVQSKQKSDTIYIQSINKNFSISLSGIIEAKKVNTKIINAVTGTTTIKRGSNKIKNAFELVDDTLGFDPRNVVKGIIENGVKGTIVNGIRKKEK